MQKRGRLFGLMAVGVVALSMVAPGRVAAQGGGLSTPACAPGGFVTPGIPDQTKAAQDACQQAYDVYQFMSPQLGLSLTGGNASLGQGGVLGGLGHFTLGVRGNVFKGRLPQVDQFDASTNGAQQRELPSKDQVMGLPTADGSIGLFKGFPLGLTRVAGVDALVSVSYIPSINASGVSVSPDNNWQFGYGARVGLVSESIITPAVSVTWLERDLPSVDLTGGSGDVSVSISDFKVKTNAWRIVASKNFIFFSLAAGAGQDRYDQHALITGTVQDALLCGATGCSATVPKTSQKMTRNNYFGDLSINVPFFSVVVEGGVANGGVVQTYNSFAGAAGNRSQAYGSAGLRFRW